MSVLSGLIAVGKWFDQICSWRNPITTVLIHILFLILVLYPELILPTIFLYMFLIGIWYYRWKPRNPPHMDTRLSCADTAHPDELDEEFDTFPTSRAPDVIRMRYDRIRSIAGRMQTVIGDLATQGERFQSLISWRDPRATSLFVVFCLLAAVVLYVTPFQVVAILTGFYVLRHPRFRRKLPSVPVNFFRRLPARTDCMLWGERCWLGTWVNIGVKDQLLFCSRMMFDIMFFGCILCWLLCNFVGLSFNSDPSMVKYNAFTNGAVTKLMFYWFTGQISWTFYKHFSW